MYCLQFTIHGSLKFVFGQLFMRDRDDTLILINGISRIALIFDQMDGTDYRATQTNVEHVKTFSKNRLE